MDTRRRSAEDDDRDRNRVMSYLRSRPGQSCEEAEIKQATGVNKAIIRRLVADEPGVDAEALAKGVVRWMPQPGKV
jgi:hypothetical protein